MRTLTAKRAGEISGCSSVTITLDVDGGGEMCTANLRCNRAGVSAGDEVTPSEECIFFDGLTRPLSVPQQDLPWEVWNR